LLQNDDPRRYCSSKELVDGLPPSVASIIDHLARWAKGYDNHFKSNEQAMFKADLMNVRRRWINVDVSAFRDKCVSEGMRLEDVELLVGWLTKAKAGIRLVPQASYRTHVFNPPSEESEVRGRRSRELQWPTIVQRRTSRPGHPWQTSVRRPGPQSSGPPEGQPFSCTALEGFRARARFQQPSDQ
jgi:hypothetical protein